MRLITLLLGICLMLGLNSCQQDFRKLDDSEIDDKKVQIAKKFAIEFYTKLKNGSYYQFKDEATDRMVNFLSEEKQKSGYQSIKSQFGDFQSLEYAETWTQRSNPKVQIIRFKSTFDKSNRKLEIRVVLNEADIINGFWIKPWSDMFMIWNMD